MASRLAPGVSRTQPACRASVDNRVSAVPRASRANKAKQASKASVAHQAPVTDSNACSFSTVYRRTSLAGSRR